MPHRFALVLLISALAQAELLRIELIERTDVLEGRAFGTAGAYEKIRARAHFAVDPGAKPNSGIVDIDKAPRNAEGRVEFSADLYVLKPRDPAAGNKIVLFEVPNRGGKGMIGIYNRARAAADPKTEADFGDRTLLDQGYTLVWLGWQHDVPKGPHQLRLHAPVAKGVEGWVRSEYVAGPPSDQFPLGDARHLPYPVSDPSRAKVTVRDGILGKRVEIPRDQWSLTDDGFVKLAQSMEPGRYYEIVYPSTDPVVTGLGLAGIRDLISFLRYGENNVTLLGDQFRHIKHTLAVGTSQSAMVLREILHGGFNADEKGRRVFDGIYGHVPGGRRSTFYRFSQPSRTAGPLRNATLSRTDEFPFTDGESTDAVSGRKDGLLARYTAETTPKIIYSNSTYEYWGSAGSLLHTTPDGKRDLPPPATTRIYLMSGGQHGPAPFPPSAGGNRNLANPNDYRWVNRALLEAMRAWVVEGKEPPAPRYPRIADGTLVPVAKVKQPRMPGLALPDHAHAFLRAEYGSEPPVPGKPFVSLVPQVDADGNDIAGVRTPELQNPLGTYTGWNLRDPKLGPAGELSPNTGSYIPFAATKAEREASKDPRRSIEERYKNLDDYLAKITATAKQLAADRLILERDIPAIVKAAEARWRWHHKQLQSSK